MAETERGQGSRAAEVSRAAPRLCCCIAVLLHCVLGRCLTLLMVRQQAVDGGGELGQLTEDVLELSAGREAAGSGRRQQRQAAAQAARRGGAAVCSCSVVMSSYHCHAVCRIESHVASRDEETGSWARRAAAMLCGRRVRVPDSDGGSGCVSLQVQERSEWHSRYECDTR